MTIVPKEKFVSNCPISIKNRHTEWTKHDTPVSYSISLTIYEIEKLYFCINVVLEIKG